MSGINTNPNTPTVPAVTPIIQYYSGSQVQVFIEDILVDDSASFTLNVQQNKTPIFGYGSQHHDIVAKGIVSIQGTLTINYQEPNYLWIIIANKLLKAKSSSQSSAKAQAQQQTMTLAMNSPDLNTQLAYAMKAGDLQNDPNGDIANFYKSQFWGLSAPASKVMPQEPLNHNPFDMFFLYNGDGPTIIERLDQVEIIGDGKMVQIDGHPVQEQYQFLARRFQWRGTGTA